ncbi:MAG: TetR/AcrR family transcriptional regulator [Corallococcus sp.]|nr:TetR/AcrR family transcriptional regulator [Corallococcus sp.]
MAKKTDYRVILTQKMFKTAFFQLMKEKSIQEITIRELCSVAGVNRGTFYSHYEDIYDLLHRIEDEMYNEFIEVVQKTLLAAQSMSVFYTELFKFFKNNSEMCTMMLSRNSDQLFVQKLLNYGEQLFVLLYRDKIGINEKSLRAYYTFISGGCLSILRVWVNNGFSESVEEMSGLLQMIIEKGVSEI